jgi:16S rRNA C967 or C1407 C5-methylase (RsmB/RsmF family)
LTMPGKVGAEELTEYATWEDVPVQVREREKLEESMFAGAFTSEILAELPHCLRVMPHHQNTSGFFITIFEKIKEVKNPDSSS